MSDDPERDPGIIDHSFDVESFYVGPKFDPDDPRLILRVVCPHCDRRRTIGGVIVRDGVRFLSRRGPRGVVDDGWRDMRCGDVPLDDRVEGDVATFYCRCDRTSSLRVDALHGALRAKLDWIAADT